MLKTRQLERLTPESHETLLTILETLPGALFVLDDASIIIYANASAQALLGATPETLVGNSFWRCAPQLVSTALYQAIQKTKQTRALTEVQYVSSVTQRWLHVHLSSTSGGLTLQFHEMGAPAGRQEIVHQRESLYMEVLENVHAGIVFLTPEGIVLDLNKVPLDDAQIRREEVVGKPLVEGPWWSFAPPCQAQLRAAIKRASRGETVRFETPIHPREGMERHLEVAITPHRDADHHVEYLVMAGIDITARKRAEAELHTLIDAIPQFVWILRPDGFSEYGNQRWRDYTGMTHQQYQGDGWLQAIHPDDSQHTLTVWHHACASGEPFEIEYRLKEGKTEGYRWFLARAMPVRDDAGQIVKWFGTCTDIEEQKRTEEALRQSQERASTLMNSNIIGINVAEGEQIVDANDTFLRMTGYTREDLRAGHINWMRMTPPEYLARTQQAHQELATQQSMPPYEKEYVCKDGSRLPVLVGRVVLQYHPSQAIGFVLDNSARKELEQRKDDFISMASHELRNPLAALKMQTQLVRKRLEKQSQHEAATALSRVEGPVKQLERLIGELLDVSKIQAGRLEYVRETVDLDALLHEVADTMQQLHTTHTIVVRGAAPRLLVGDKDRLGQVFTNLLSNAIKYSPGAETVEMDLSTSEETVTVRVHDHGLGIPREQHDKIFERFYRATGPRQKAIPGLGMGLYIVAEIVKRHGGTITVDSTVGKGSTFTVTLPRNRDT
ncbi:hypothetical protein KSC_025390 [Ktedonobacter sp. SOSP1-52]|uniref:PAS domain S-box protein n=1 Tax=Ktedonobacter sp. SOSP1-52 TaxID=2778366 RepID=UPI0019159BCD|nr:PAS domain S-box protein [Ktedonobacter sp. SOSP1-52]GHO63647.1 hypothetical protein KSC_025390 [Ktedonobacter sp. SOSP1-52]